MTMRAFTILAAGLMTTATSLWAQEDPINIIVITHTPAANDVTNVLRNGAELAAAQMNVNLQFVSNETFDMVWMAQILSQTVGSAPDGIALTIPDADALGEGVRLAVDSGIAVVAFNSGLRHYEELGALAYVGADNYVGGFGAGERLRAAGATFGVCVHMEIGNFELDERCRGFSDAMDGNTEILATTIDIIEIRDAVAAYMTEHPDTDALLSTWSGRITSVMDGLEAADRVGQVAVTSFALSPEILDYIAAGSVDSAIDEQLFLQGYLPVMLLANNIRYGLLPATTVIETGPGFVDKTNTATVVELIPLGIR